jgi:hypothetical protein
MRALLFLFAVLLVSFIMAADPGEESCSCTDYDSDGYYSTSCQDSDCSPRTDCNDDNANIHPDATEVTCNNIDEDCFGGPATPTGASDDDGDGYSDNSCSGSVGSGDCNDDNSGINPGVAEVVCNSIDENCNGMTDDTVGVGNSCGTIDVGACSFGTNQCVNGSLTCVGAINPETSDTCNDGLDTNCDGTDGFIEVCNNQDDDCDGSVDEGLTGTDTLVNALGACVDVETTCYDGNYGYDTGLYSEPPAEEICYDGLDNDCEGGIDEGCDFSLITDNYTGQVPSDNRYCTGSYGGFWIDDLNPAADTDFEDFTAYGQYKFACEAQGSFYWSGERCCGSNTKFYKDSDSIILFKEYFADDLAGCFRGKPIPNDWTVGKAVNNKMYDDLLFFNSKYWGCDTEGKYSSLNIQYHPNNVLSDQLVTEEVNSSAIRGTWACIGNKWRAFDDIPKIRIIAGALIKEIEDQDYYLFCDDENEYVVTDYTQAYSELMQNGSCLMNILDSDVTTFGFGFEDYVDFQDIMDLMGLTQEICDNVDEGSDSDHKFFSECGEEDGLTVFIRKDFGIGLIANGDITPDDFFLVDIWKVFVSFIKGILSALGFNVGGVTEYDIPLHGIINNFSSDNFNKFYSAKSGSNSIDAYSLRFKEQSGDVYKYNVYASYGVLEDLCEFATYGVCTYECGITSVEITSEYQARVLWRDLTSKTRLQEGESYILGCTDSEANNYNIDATVDDCNCGYSESGNSSVEN